MPTSYRFSRVYGISRGPGDDWFDPLLDQDTHLYIDPFLIFLERSGRWTNAHPEMMLLFARALELLAESGFKKTTARYRAAEELLTFPEPPEFCLGTCEDSIFGRGSAKKIREGMIKGAGEAMKLGLDDLRHFEELALFGELVGPDRIGDMACDVLKPAFIEYTQDIARRHGIPLVEVNVGTNGWDERTNLWLPGTGVLLPNNPHAEAIKGHPVGVILVPKRFLRKMPSINGKDFWDFARSEEIKAKRSALNAEIGKQADADKIARLARRKRALLTQFLDNLEAEPTDPYDVEQDPDLLVRKLDLAKDVAAAITVAPPKTQEELEAFVDELFSRFQHTIEAGGWDLLWVNGIPRSEKQVQSLFVATVRQACVEGDVDLSGESNAGRGPVDFKLSRGAAVRVMIEFKLASSSKLQKNLKGQLPTYGFAENCNRGYFVVIQFRDNECDPKFVSHVTELAEKVSADSGLELDVRFIDARRKPPGSKV